jgi:hypothetical protein
MGEELGDYEDLVTALVLADQVSDQVLNEDL